MTRVRIGALFAVTAIIFAACGGATTSSAPASVAPPASTGASAAPSAAPSASEAAAPKAGGYTITLANSLELKDQSGAVVWRADPKETADAVSTPPQDYYRNFRLCIPAVPPGTYTLAVKTIDRPTGREVRKAIEVRVAAR